MKWEKVIGEPEGPRRTGALVAWIQGLARDGEAPILVGGAAVELLTDGGYRTTDLDFVGTVSSELARGLLAVGFEKRGRHWVHEAEQVFLEFPAAELDPDAEVVEVRVGEARARVLSPEDLLVDRLAAAKFWASETDGANALWIWRRYEAQVDERRLERLAVRHEVDSALKSLRGFSSSLGKRNPSADELSTWCKELAR